jgi:hypothetical protein
MVKTNFLLVICWIIDVERFCAACSQERIMRQHYRIVKYPPILCIQLERALPDKTNRNQSSVDFPLNNFRPHQYFEPNNESVNSTEYYLFALVNHVGKKNFVGGHYTAVCRQGLHGEWWNYDDDVVQLAQITQRNKANGTVLSSFQKTATMLFYCKYDERTSSTEMSVLTSNENDDDDESRFSSPHEDYGNSNSNVDGEANNGTGNTDANDTGNSNDSTIQKVSTSIIISAKSEKYYTFHLYFTFNVWVIVN